MKGTAALIAAAILAVAAPGCIPVEYADQEFMDALPIEDDLVVKIGSEDDEIVAGGILSAFGALDPFVDSSCAEELCVEEVAGEDWYVDGPIYQATREAKWNVNGGLVTTMGWVWTIVTSPDPEQTSAGYIWGPWHEALSRIEFRFVMDKIRAGRFTFQLEGRNINDATGDWTTVVDGAIDAGDYPHASAGSVVIDYDAIHEIDTSHPTFEAGRITYAFDVRDYPYTVDAQFEGFVPYEDQQIDAVYSYVRDGVGMSGSLSFEVDYDLWPSDEPDGIAEALTVLSRWNDVGQGRGEASVTGGTLALDGSNIDSLEVDECWAGLDCLFYGTYASTEIDYNDATPDAVVPGCGSAFTCPSF